MDEIRKVLSGMKPLCARPRTTLIALAVLKKKAFAESQLAANEWFRFCLLCIYLIYCIDNEYVADTPVFLFDFGLIHVINLQKIRDFFSNKKYSFGRKKIAVLRVKVGQNRAERDAELCILARPTFFIILINTDNQHNRPNYTKYTNYTRYTFHTIILVIDIRNI